MDDLHKLLTIRSALMCATGAMLVYRNPPNGKQRTESLDNTEKLLLESLEATGKVKLDLITLWDLSQLGFRPYRFERSLLLLPLWVYPFIDDEQWVVDIYGKGGTFREAKHAVDALDGLLPYGVIRHAKDSRIKISSFDSEDALYTNCRTLHSRALKRTLNED